MLSDRAPSIREQQTEDYHFFDPRAYVEEYYSTIGAENTYLMHFHRAVAQTLPADSRMLEFGGGPTIYQLLNAADQVGEIVFSDYLQRNRAEVRKWLDADIDAINWDSYLDFVLRLQEVEPTPQARGWLRRKLASKVSGIIECDAFRSDVLGAPDAEAFDVVASSFCLECLTGEESEFLAAVGRVERLLKPGGTLVLALLKRAEGYKVGDLYFPAFPLDEGYATALLEEIGYEIMFLGSCPAEHQQGYEGLITVAAVKR